MYELPETRNSLLVRLSNATDTGAWVAFQAIYEPTIYQLAKDRGLQDSDARDVTQEVLLAVHCQIGAWEYGTSKGTFRGWLFRVTRNLTLKAVRQRGRRSRQLVYTDILDQWPVSQDTGASLFLLEYQRQAFQWAAKSIRNRFEPASWQAFVRTGIGAEVAAEVAADLGMSVGAVYAAKCRIMSQLRDLVERLTSEEKEQFEEPLE